MRQKYCFSATASKDGIDLIAVIMGAPDFKIRFSEARSLLEYGFALTRLYVDENKEPLGDILVTGGKADTAWSGTKRNIPLSGYYRGGF